MGHEGNGGTKLSADLPLVNVIRQGVRDDVVGEVLDIVLGAWLGASAGVSRNTKDGGLSTEVGNNRSDSNLSSGGIAAGVGNTSSLGDLGATDQLGQAIGPLVVETVVGAQVDNHVSVVGTLVNSINEGLADTVGKGHHPAVDITVG